jgi:YHS domain-containing protein
MNQVKDPVCGTMIDPDSAQAGTIYESQEIYFCSNRCRRTFEAEPARFRDHIERHEPPYTVTKGFAAPKFGSAASGGLEYEPAPERHDGE